MTNEPQSVDTALAQIHEWLRSGLTEPAEAHCRQLLGHSPHVAAAWFYLGRIALQRMDLPAAESALRKANALNDQQAIFCGDLSVAIGEQRRHPEAEAWARRAITLDAAPANFWLSLGNALFGQARWEEAASAYRECVARDATLASAWNNLGSAEHRLGRLAAAARSYERSLAFAPEQWDTLRSYAAILNRLGQAQHAEPLLRRVLDHAPTMAQAWQDLGNSLTLLGRHAEAELAFQTALTLAPGDRETRLGLALVLVLRWKLREAEAVAREVLIDDAQSADAWRVLGQALLASGQSGEAMSAFERSASLQPGPLIDSAVLLASQYAESATPGQLLTTHRCWDANHAQRLYPAQPPVAVSATGRPLRLGFVSADFGRHPIGFLTARVLEHFDRRDCSIVCYSDRLEEDDVTARFRGASADWRRTASVPDEELAEQIRQDKIDVLFDMAGHTGNRLLLFARKPAALQVAWLGYVGTTGLTAMDSLLADRFHVPIGEESHYTEQILRMPHCYVCYSPPAETPAVGALPALSLGRVTFGCFNNVCKHGPVLFDAWAEILRQTPLSQVLLKYGGLDEPARQDDIYRQFAARGIEPTRIRCEGWSPHRELLAAYNRVDLALDTQPYSGGLTTCEALWMGVPVITYPGRTFAGRHSTSFLSTAGCEQFIAANVAEYCAIAVAWANQLDELAAIRAGLREQMRQSPVCDAPRFAADLLSLLRQAWEARAR